MTELPKQDLLLKLLGMTTSASDNEALMAIRRAPAGPGRCFSRTKSRSLKIPSMGLATRAALSLRKKNLSL